MTTKGASLLPLLLAAAAVAAVRAATPEVVGATVSVSQVRSLEVHRRSGGEAVHTAASVSVRFAEPLLANGRPLADMGAGEAEAALRGATRLWCGGEMVDSHPPHGDNDGGGVGGGAGYLVAHGGRSGGNAYEATLLLPRAGALAAVVAGARERDGCELEFLGAEAQDWEPPVNVTTAAGRAVTGRVPLEPSAARGAAAHVRDTTAASAVSRHVVAYRTAAQAIEARRADESPLATHLVALLEVCDSLATTAEVEARQLEAVADPVMAVAIPVAVMIIISLVKSAIISITAQTLIPLMVDPVVKPVIKLLLPPPGAADDDPPPKMGPGDMPGYAGASQMDSAIAGGSPDSPLPHFGSDGGVLPPAAAVNDAKPPDDSSSSSSSSGSSASSASSGPGDDSAEVKTTPDMAALKGDDLEEAKRRVAKYQGHLGSWDIPQAVNKKSVRKLWQEYAAAGAAGGDGDGADGDGAANAAPAGAEATITAVMVERKLNRFLDEAMRLGAAGAAGKQLSAMHTKFATCIRSKLHGTAQAIVSVLDRDGVPGVQWSEWKRDWNYDNPGGRDAPEDAYMFRKLCAVTMEHCRRQIKEISDKAVADAWSEWDTDQTGTISLPEMTEAIRKTIPAVAGTGAAAEGGPGGGSAGATPGGGSHPPDIDPVTMLPLQVMTIDTLTGLPFRVFGHEGAIPFGYKFPAASPAAAAAASDAVGEVVRCALPLAPKYARAAMKLDTGGLPGIDLSEFRKLPTVVALFARKAVAECAGKARAAKLKHFARDADTNGDGRVDGDELGRVVRQMTADAMDEAVRPHLDAVAAAAAADARDGAPPATTGGAAAPASTVPAVSGRSALARPLADARYRQIREATARAATRLAAEAAALGGGLEKKQFFEREAELRQKVATLVRDEVEQMREADATASDRAADRADRRAEAAADRRAEDEGAAEDARAEDEERDRERADNEDDRRRAAADGKAELAAQRSAAEADRRREAVAEARDAREADQKREADRRRGATAFAALDRDGDGTVTISEMDAHVRSATAKRLGARYVSSPLLRQCVGHTVHELAVHLVQALDADGRAGVQAAEMATGAKAGVVSGIVRELAVRCKDVERSELERMWASYDRDRDGRLTVDELRGVYREMLAFSRRYYGAEAFPALKRCVAPKVDALAARVMRELGDASAGGVSRDAFEARPFLVLSEAERVAEACQRAGGAKGPFRAATSYEENYARALWRQYVGKEGDAAAGVEGATLSENGVARVFEDMLRYAREHSALADAPAGVVRCLEDEALRRRYAKAVMRHLDRNGRPGLQWDEFRAAPNTVVRQAEHMALACQRAAAAAPSQTDGGAGARFAERLVGAPPPTFGQYMVGFVVPVAALEPHGDRRRRAMSHSVQGDINEVLLQLSRGGKEFDKGGLDNDVAPIEKSAGPLGDRVVEATTDSGSEVLFHALSQALGSNLMHSLNTTCTRKLTRSMTELLTVKLTDSLGGALLGSVSDPYVDVATRLLVHGLVPSLSVATATTVTKAMSRHPQEDYFCWYCKERQVYCRFCKESAENDHYVDYYAAYFSRYYGEHYAQFYAVEADILGKLTVPGVPYTFDGEDGQGGEGAAEPAVAAE